MSDDLVKQLLDWEMWDEGDINDTREEAHARIEELCVLHREYEKLLRERIEELEVKLSKSKALLAKAMKALAQIGKTYTADKNRLIHGDLWIIETVQTTLAELKGETDD